MRKFIFIFICIMILCFAGCTKKVKGDEKTAEDYVKSKGYIITNELGKIDKYTLNKNKLCGGPETMQYIEQWAYQSVEPDKYFGKEIVIYGFTVKNHPMQKVDENSKNGVNVYIMISEGKVIGGYSYPNAKVVGGLSSIDGKSIEQVTGLNIFQWQEKWKKSMEIKSSSNRS